MSEIRKVRTPEDIAAVTGLVWEFFDLLAERYPDMEPERQAYMKEQNVEAQLADFATYFLPPAGECLIAVVDGEAVGCLMLKPARDVVCEMNRMFVRTSARGLGLGRKLGEALIAEARALGYREMRLGALYRHVEALPLYRSLGFVPVEEPGPLGVLDERVIKMRLEYVDGGVRCLIPAPVPGSARYRIERDEGVRILIPFVRSLCESC